MKLVDQQCQTLSFRMGALEGMSSESNPEVGGTEHQRGGPSSHTAVALELWKPRRSKGLPAWGPAVPMSPQCLRLKASA